MSRQKKPFSKEKSINLHFERRSLERLGRKLSHKERKRIIDTIRNGTAHFVRRQSIRVSQFRFHIDGAPYILTYDRERKLLVTIWPEDDRDRTAKTE